MGSNLLLVSDYRGLESTIYTVCPQMLYALGYFAFLASVYRLKT